MSVASHPYGIVVSPRFPHSLPVLPPSRPPPTWLGHSSSTLLAPDSPNYAVCSPPSHAMLRPLALDCRHQDALRVPYPVSLFFLIPCMRTSDVAQPQQHSSSRMARIAKASLRHTSPSRRTPDPRACIHVLVRCFEGPFCTP